ISSAAFSGFPSQTLGFEGVQFDKDDGAIVGFYDAQSKEATERRLVFSYPERDDFASVPLPMSIEARVPISTTSEEFGTVTTRNFAVGESDEFSPQECTIDKWLHVRRGMSYYAINQYYEY